MNLILLFEDDFLDEKRVRLTGRRLEHVRSVHRAAAGDTLIVGVCGGRLGRGDVTRLDAEALEMTVTLDREPPAPLPLTLVLALPRPKVLNRVIAGATSMGIKRIFLINAWRVEKSYWKSPRLFDENLFLQRILGLEQARDTILPAIETRRFFRPFVEDELPSIANGTRALVAHPGEAVAASAPSPPAAETAAATLAIGPEGGWIAEELAAFERTGFTAFSLGERILRVESAVAVAVTMAVRPCVAPRSSSSSNSS